MTKSEREGQLNTYGILVDDGYGFQRRSAADGGYVQDVHSLVVAETPQQARKAFLSRHRGAWYAVPERIKATKVYDHAIEDADLVAAEGTER